MKKSNLFLSVLLTALCTVASAQSLSVDSQVDRNAVKADTSSAEVKSKTYNVGNGGAYMYAYFPSSTSGPVPAVVTLPGGGYSHLAVAHEGTDWASYFTSHGMAYFTLIYRLPDGDRSRPISDAEAAIKMVRDSAMVWNINPKGVGIMGSSAGGHLASTVATHAAAGEHPDFQILFYPVITFVGKTHKGSLKCFLGKDSTNRAALKEFSNERHVEEGVTPPAIIFYAKNDKAVPPASNAVAYYKALKRKKVPVRIIEYNDGGHGFGFKLKFKYHDQLLHDLGVWLDDMKFKLK